MPTRTVSRTKARKPVHAPKPPERKAHARTAVVEREKAPRADEARPAVLREPAPRAEPKPANVFVYVNGRRVDVPASTPASALGANVRHTDAGRTPVAGERVVHSMKYTAD